MISEPAKITSLKAKILCEAPNDFLYKFEGNITFNDTNTYALDHTQLLIRGSSLKNTEWVYGLIVYTGHDTKIMKNSSKSRTKFSKIENYTNK